MKSTSPDFKESLLTWVEAPHVPRASRLVFEGQWNRSKKLVKTPRQGFLTKCMQSSGWTCAGLALVTQLWSGDSLPDSVSAPLWAFVFSYVKRSPWIQQRWMKFTLQCQLQSIEVAILMLGWEALGHLVQAQRERVLWLISNVWGCKTGAWWDVYNVPADLREDQHHPSMLLLAVVGLW